MRTRSTCRAMTSQEPGAPLSPRWSCSRRYRRRQHGHLGTGVLIDDESSRLDRENRTSVGAATRSRELAVCPTRRRGVAHMRPSGPWLCLLALGAIAGCSTTVGPGSVRTAGSSTSVTAPPPSTTATTATIGFRAVSYEGVHVEVPAGWPVVDGMHTGFCEGPFPDTPTAFVGPQQNGAPSCPAPLPDGSSTGRDGVWLQPGDPPPGATPMTTSSGQRVLEESAGSDDHYMLLWYHQVMIQIGIGPDPSTAQAIFESIGFTPGTPDTPAAGVCQRSADPDVMPTPERLVEPLVLDGGNITLNPPISSDRAVMSAAQAWSRSGPKESFERYRIILTRYSANFPARQSPDGSLTPLNRDELAWVVYSVPYSSTIAGCGDWGVTVFDAASGQGQELISSGYSPGP